MASKKQPLDSSVITKKAFDCFYCGRSFNGRSSLTAHTKTHTLEKPFKCETCHKAFSDKSNLTAHVKIHLGIKEFVCRFCFHAFTQKSSLTVHEKLHAGKKPFTCEVCSKAFSRKSHVISHMKTHNKEPKESRISKRPFKCEICSRHFVTQNAFHNHLKKKHTGQVLFQCDVCEDRFDSLDLLEEHSDFHSNIEESNVIVPIDENNIIMDSNIEEQNSFIIEPLIELSDVTSACEMLPTIQVIIPSQDFFSSIQPIRKQFTCEVCLKNFTNKFRLHLHRYFHLKEKPYYCRFCNKRFMKKSGLNFHLNFHLNYKRFACRICKRNFSKKTHLFTHVKTCLFKIFKYKILLRYITSNQKNNFIKRIQSENNIAMHYESLIINSNKKKCNLFNIVMQKLIQNSYQIIQRNLIPDKELNIQCSFCLKQFESKQYLVEHTIRVHFKNIHFPKIS